MRARWLTLLLMIVGAAPAHAEPDGTCAAACQRLAQCKLSRVDVCTRDCKQSAAEATPEGRARLVAVVRASCDQLAGAVQDQPQPTPHTPPAPQAPPRARAQPGQQRPGAQAQPAPQPPAAQRAQPASPAPRPAPETDRHVWRCTSEGSYETLRKGEIYWRPAGTSAFGFGKTQQLAITMANASCGQHMTSMMTLETITGQSRIKTPCRPTQCTPPP